MIASSRLALAMLMTSMLPPFAAMSQDPRPAAPPPTYSADELDNLVASIALYPDPILAQILIAATFPDQIAEAAAFVRQNGTKDIDEQAWDVSVKAVAHYPPVLNMMAERPDWTTALGQAYAGQSSDVMTSVQHLRQMAQAQGNLTSTPQQNVVSQGQALSIVPAQPTLIYVPTYDPAVVYYQPVRYVREYPSYFSFGLGYPIGSWLSYDFDWFGYNVFYAGWGGGGLGWRLASRPFIALSPVYVYPRPRVVRVSRNVFYRPVDFFALRRFNTVHRNVDFGNRVGERHDFDGRGTWRDRDGSGHNGSFYTPRHGVTGEQRTGSGDHDRSRRQDDRGTTPPARTAVPRSGQQEPNVMILPRHYDAGERTPRPQVPPRVRENVAPPREPRFAQPRQENSTPQGSPRRDATRASGANQARGPRRPA